MHNLVQRFIHKIYIYNMGYMFPIRHIRVDTTKCNNCTEE